MPTVVIRSFCAAGQHPIKDTPLEDLHQFPVRLPLYDVRYMDVLTFANSFLSLIGMRPANDGFC